MWCWGCDACASCWLLYTNRLGVCCRFLVSLIDWVVTNNPWKVGKFHAAALLREAPWASRKKKKKMTHHFQLQLPLFCNRTSVRSIHDCRSIPSIIDQTNNQQPTTINHVPTIRNELRRKDRLLLLILRLSPPRRPIRQTLGRMGHRNLRRPRSKNIHWRSSSSRIAPGWNGEQLSYQDSEYDEPYTICDAGA